MDELIGAPHAPYAGRPCGRQSKCGEIQYSFPSDHCIRRTVSHKSLRPLYLWLYSPYMQCIYILTPLQVFPKESAFIERQKGFELALISVCGSLGDSLEIMLSRLQRYTIGISVYLLCIL